MSTASKWAKRIGIALVVLLLTPILVLGLALVALQFPPVRGFARDKLLEVVSSSLQGRLEVDDLRWPSLSHIELSGVRLWDRHKDEVANIGLLSVHIDLAALMAVKVHVTEVTVDQLFLDLGTLDNNHGLLSVFESKEPAPPPEEKGGSSLEVQIDRACIEGTEIKAKPQPDLAVALSRFDACVMFRMADAMDIRLDSLRGEVRYNDNPTIQFVDEKAVADWDAQPAEAHGVGRELAKAFLKGKLTIADPAMAFDGRLELRGVSKRTLEAAQVDAAWLTGAADASLAVRGDVSHMTYMFQLRAPDSRISAEGEVSPETSAVARISSEGLQLAKFTTIAIEPVKFAMEINADLARKAGPAIKARLTSGSYGKWALPTVKTDVELGPAGKVVVPRFEARYPAAQVVGRAQISEGGAIEASLEANADLAKVPPVRAMLPGWSGQLAADAKFTRPSEGAAIAVRSHASLLKLAADEPALAAEKVDLKVSIDGQADKPVVNANLSVSELHVSDQRLAELQLTASGGPELYNLQGNVDGDRGGLNAWVKLADSGLEAGGQIDARLSRGPATVKLDHLRVVSGQSLELNELRVTHIGASLVANGSLGLAGKPSQLDIEGRVDNLGSLTQELGMDKLPGRIKLTAHVTGALDKPSVDLNFDLRDGPRLAGAPSSLSLQARLDGEGGKANIHARANAGKAGVRAALDSRWRKGAPLATAVDGHHELQVTLDQVEIAELLRQSETPTPVPLKGTIGANLAVSGNLASIDLKSQIDARVEIGEEPALGVKMITEYGGGGLAFNAEVEDPHGNLFQASWHQATRVESFVEHPPVLPEWLGKTDWEASIQLASRRLSEFPTVRTQRLMHDLWPLRAEASIELSHKAGAEPIGDVKVKTGWDPLYVDPTRATCSQRVKPAIELTGKLREGLFVTKVRGGVQDKQMLSIDAQLGSTLEEWLEGHVLQIVKAKIKGKLENFDLASWPVTCEQAAGMLTASFTANELFDKTAEFRAKLGGEGIVVGQSLPFDFALEAQALPSGMDVMTRIDRIGGYALIKGSVPISVYVHDPATSVDMNGKLALEVALNRVDAKSLLQLVPAVARPSGTLDGRIQVYGTLGKPRGTGSIAMKDVSLTLPKLGQRFTKVNGSIGIADNRVRIPELELKDQGGTAKFRAELVLESTDVFDVDLNAKFSSFPVRKQGVLIGRADAGAKVLVKSKPAQTDVQVKLSGVSVDLTGDTGADVQSLETNPEIAVVGEAQEVEEEPDPAATQAIINVSVHSDDPIWVRRDDFAVRMRADLGVHVANGAAAITGEVKLERGYIALLGQQFDVKAGRVTFTGGQTVNPSLELTAESTTKSGSVVRVEVTGFVSAPQLAFSIDDQAATAGDAVAALAGFGDKGGGAQQSAEDQMASAAIGMTTGLLSLGARREFGDWIPMLSINQTTQDTQVRAGFEADKLIPKFMRGFVRGAYVEGIVSTGGDTTSRGGETGGNAQTGVLLELMLPRDLVWAGKYGPGQTWSLDLDWRP